MNRPDYFKWGEGLGPSVVPVPTESHVDLVHKLQDSLSKVVPALVTNSMQNSIELVLSFLGCGKSLIPVVLPVTASLDTFAAVLRVGALPFVLDVDADGQINEDHLTSVFAEFEKGCIVLLTRPLGFPVRPSLTLACAGVPTVIVSDFLPPAEVSSTTMLGDFNIFDLSLLMAGEGSVVYTPYLQSRNEIGALRKSLEGPSCLPGALSCALALRRLEYLGEREKLVREVAGVYAQHLGAQITSDQAFPYFPILRTKNPHKLPYALKPLHHIPAVAARYPQGKPSYPGGDAVSNFLALPCHPDMLGDPQELFLKLGV